MDDFESGSYAFDERDSYNVSDTRPSIGVHLTIVPRRESNRSLRGSINALGGLLATTVEYSANATVGAAYAGYAAAANTVKFVEYSASVVPHMLIGTHTDAPDYLPLALKSK
jgi:hypothetical protein